jgi:hypothetical protein
LLAIGGVASLAGSEEEAMQVLTAVMVALTAVVGVAVFATRRRTVVAEVMKNARLAGLPADPASFDEAVSRERRRVDCRLYGGFGALAIGAPALLLNSQHRLAVFAWLAFCWLGTVVGAWFGHLRELHRRRRTVARRAAQLRRRRLMDYLSPLEVVALCVSGLLPVWPACLALVTLGDVDAGQSSVLFASSVLGLLFLLMIGMLLRAALSLPSLAASETALRWEEAERARSLRDLAAMAVALSLMLGGIVPNLALDEPATYPAASLVALLPPVAGFGVHAALLIAAEQSWAVRRSQRTFAAPGGAQ